LLTVQILMNGLTLSAQYALLAVGFSMIYGISKIVNFAHGSFYMWGGFLAYALHKYAHFPYFVAILGSTALCFLIGILLNKIVIERVVGNELRTMIVTLGLSMILVNAAEVTFGAQSVTYSSPFKGTLEIGHITLPSDRIFVLITVAAVLSLLFWMLYHTKFGLALRTLASDKEMASIHGINTKIMISLAFGLGALLAGLSGGILTSVYVLSPNVGDNAMLMSFMVVILGGIGNMVGGVYAALGVGLLQSFVTTVIGGNWANICLFVCVIILLLWRPAGILGIVSAKRE
jgi:branched-chain amino acid transport system permease protein